MGLDTKHLQFVHGDCDMGAGFVADIFVVFLVKSCLLFWRVLRSSRWPRMSANLVRVSVLDPDWGCPSIKVSFTGDLSEKFRDSTSEVPFVFLSSARQYARRLESQGLVTVRVDPGSANRAWFFCLDQKRVA